MNQLSYPCALTPLQIQLSHRQRRQVLSRPPLARRALAHLAARAFLPADDSLIFDSPIQPLGSVVLVVLSRRFLGHPDGTADEQVLIRGYTAQLDQATAITHWGPETSSFLYDLGQPVYPNAVAPALPVEKTALVRIALDLDRQIERCASQHSSFASYPSLPPTLLGFEPGTAFSPEPTPLVSAYAEQNGIPWQQGWHEIFHGLQVPDDLNPRKLAILDSRLALSVQSVSNEAPLHNAFHDLRRFLGRAVHNPIRDGALPHGTCDAESNAMLRRRLPRDLARVCTDTDLAKAVSDSRSPLIIPGLSKLFTWKPPTGADTFNPFRFEGPGTAADLWNVNSPQERRESNLPLLLATLV